MTWRTRDGLRAGVRAKGIHSIMAAVPATPSLRTGYLTRALDKAARSNYYKRAVTIVYPVRTAASQAAKTGSNPVGDAKRTNGVEICPVGRISSPLSFSGCAFPMPLLRCALSLNKVRAFLFLSSDDPSSKFVTTFFCRLISSAYAQEFILFIQKSYGVEYSCPSESREKSHGSYLF